jgi:hypothetical protein
VRVIHEGSAVKGMEWIGLDEFVGMLEGMVPGNVLGECFGG